MRTDRPWTSEENTKLSLQFAELSARLVEMGWSEGEVGDVEHAFEIACDEHGRVNDRRKLTDEPSMVHPIQVATRMLRVPGVTSTEIAGLILHDVIEDTDLTVSKLAHLVKREQAEFVLALTQIAQKSDGNRKARMAINLRHIAQATPMQKSGKCCDIVDNAETLIQDVGFWPVWSQEKRDQLNVMTEADPTVWAEAMAIVSEEAIDTSDIPEAGEEWFRKAAAKQTLSRQEY